MLAPGFSEAFDFGADWEHEELEQPVENDCDKVGFWPDVWRGSEALDSQLPDCPVTLSVDICVTAGERSDDDDGGFTDCILRASLASIILILSCILLNSENTTMNISRQIYAHILS